MAEKKDKILCIKIKPSEYKEVAAVAEKYNKTLSEFVRDTLMNKVRRG